MSSSLSLDQFIGACKECVHERDRESVTPDAFIWRDLGLAGEDWWDFSVSVLENLNADYKEDRASTFDIYDFIPNEANALSAHWRMNAKTIPDIRLREVFAFIRSGLNERSDGK